MMADPLSIIGGLAAGLQLVSSAAEALLVTIKLMKDLKEMPEKLSTLVNEVDSSTSRLCQSCNAGARIFQNLDPPQMERLGRCASTLRSALQNIQSMLAPLLIGSRNRILSFSSLWKALVYLKLEKELPDKLQRLNRLNIELIRELGFIGLERNLMMTELITANNAASSRGYNTIEAKMDSLQEDFRSFSLSVRRVQEVALESPIENRDACYTRQPFPEDEKNKNHFDPSISSMYDTGNTPGTTLRDSRALEEVRTSTQRAEQMRMYLTGNGNIGTVAGLQILPPSDILDNKLQHILISLQTFYTAGNFDASSAVTQPKFWADTDTAVYLMKVSQGAIRGSSQSQTRAFRILKNSTAGVSNILNQGTATILIEILSTLSPVNTVTCPYVREGMLRYLYELAQEQLPTTHPIRIVLSELKDDRGDKNVTLRALRFIVDRLRSKLGPVHELSRLSLYRLCSLLRRGGDFIEALQTTNEGISAVRAVLGPNSLHERWLSRQLEHVYMDQGDWVSALSVCFDIVGQRQLDLPNPDPLYHDECAVMTMEDIAKTCECAGNIPQAIAWLKQASLSGSMVWGNTEALAHIHDKLRELLAQVGNQEDLNLWTVSFDIS
jgi:hypothetical protein